MDSRSFQIGLSVGALLALVLVFALYGFPPEYNDENGAPAVARMFPMPVRQDNRGSAGAQRCAHGGGGGLPGNNRVYEPTAGCPGV